MTLTKLTEEANRLGAQVCAVLEASGLGAPETQTRASDDLLVSFRRQTGKYRGTAPLLKVLYQAESSRYRLTLALDHKLSTWWLRLRPAPDALTHEVTVPVSYRAALDLEAKVEGLLATAHIAYLIDMPPQALYKATLAHESGDVMQVEVRAVDAAKAIVRALAFVGQGYRVEAINAIDTPTHLHADEVVCALHSV